MNDSTQQPKLDDETLLADTGISKRALRACHRAHLRTIGDVRAFGTENMTARLRNFGDKSLREIEALLGIARVNVPIPPCAQTMTIRDYFAGQALAGMDVYTLIAQRMNARPPEDDAKTMQSTIDTTTQIAYRIADAMLAAREAK